MKTVVLWIIVILVLVVLMVAYWQWRNLGLLVSTPRELTPDQRQQIVAAIQVPLARQELTVAQRQQIINTIMVPAVSH